MDKEKLEKANRLMYDIKFLKRSLESWEKYTPDLPEDDGYRYLLTSYVQIPGGAITESMLEDIKSECCQKLQIALELTEAEFKDL